jgi:predicted ATPase
MMFLNRNQIVGRQSQLQLLNECYTHMTKAHTSDLVMVHGPSGVGKSALVKAFVNSLPSEIFHVQGKFDQLKSRTLRMRLLLAASDHLCRLILRRENSGVIRDRIRALLGKDATLLGI